MVCKRLFKFHSQEINKFFVGGVLFLFANEKWIITCPCTDRYKCRLNVVWTSNVTTKYQHFNKGDTWYYYLKNRDPSTAVYLNNDKKYKKNIHLLL